MIPAPLHRDVQETPAGSSRERGRLTVSVVATVRNEGAGIAAFVDSLVGQTRTPDEIIIVDGRSTDGTTQILERYAADHGITLISQDCNIAQGRNIGIRHARGVIVAVTDAGCRVDSGWLEQIVDCFARVKDADVVAGNFKFETFSRFEESVVMATFVPGREEREIARYYPSSRSAAFRKIAWERAGGYPEWLYAAEDTLFNIRLRQIGCRFVFSREAIVRWRPRETLRALAKQRFNFARGNARVGIGVGGALINLRYHGAMLAFLLLAALHPAAVLGALAVAGLHVKRHLWSHAQEAAAGSTDRWAFWRVLGVMEFVRVVNMAGFIAGRWDRSRDPSFIANQLAYMGVTSADEVPLADERLDRDAAGLPDAASWRRRLLRALPWPGPLPPDPVTVIRAGVAMLGLVAGAAALVLADDAAWVGAGAVLATAAVGTVALTLKSLKDFTQTGPRIRREILKRFRIYTSAAVLRLALAAFAILAFTAGGGVFLAALGALAFGASFPAPAAVSGAVLGIAVAATLQFCRMLVLNPGLLVASMQYRASRLYPLWSRLSRGALSRAMLAGAAGVAVLVAGATYALERSGQLGALAAVWLGLAFFGATIFCAGWLPEARPVRRAKAGALPNIVMIGSDTLRADRLGIAGYHRALTPTLDGLATRGVQFTECFVPCARTAPSLISLLTGTWPHRHGIRDNFVAGTDLGVDSLPEVLAALGYSTAAVSDWCGADMGKFPLGFRYLQVPEDQWNVKYLIRQGPKDLRLFLSLFTHNELGRLLLPEVYYLGGVPLTSQVGKRGRRVMSRLIEQGRPFFLNIFFSTTHPPFASEHPYYARCADPGYAGESKFAMARLTDPFDIIRRQGDSRKEFDLDQIVNLYDGCVSQFDAEVGRFLRYIESSGIADSTIIVVYSDHGMELFEHDTWGQGNSVRGDASAKIPLIIVDPRRTAKGVCRRIVRSIDVAPTLLDLLEQPLPPMDGVSLRPYLDGSGGDLQLDAFSETGIWLTEVPGLPRDHLRYPDLFDLIEVPDKHTGTLVIRPEYREIVVRAKDRMIRSGRWKLTYQPTESGAIYALYDIAADPECKRDVSTAHPDIVEELSARLYVWMGKRERWSPASKAHLQ